MSGVKRRFAKWMKSLINRKSRFWPGRFPAFIGLFLLVGGCGAAFWGFLSFRPVRGAQETPVIVVPGETVSGIAQNLQENHLLRSGLMFRFYYRIFHKGASLQAGHYVIPQGSSIPEIEKILESGHGLNHSVKVTIPEGFTVEQIGQRLAEKGICSKRAFLTEVQHGVFTEPFLRYLPQNTAVRYRLEGYLFPDTYEFFKGETAHQTVNEMLRTFQEKIHSQLPVMRQRKISLREAVTEASLVEREAKVEKERPLIAGVIVNRLQHKPPMKLQIDASVEYAAGHSNAVLVQDLKVKSPYNTYLYNGLPPGPIANPGMQSLLAVLRPTSSSYLYYVVKNNGSGEHFFAETFARQLHNEALSHANFKKYSQRS